MDIAKCFKKCVEVVHQYGPWKIFETLCFICIFIYLVYGMPMMIQKYAKEGNIQANTQIENERALEHSRLMELRRSIQPQIDEMLTSMITDIDASRAFIMEMHNGSSNTNGIPFMKCSLTYFDNRNGVEDISEEFQNISLSRFKLATYLHNYHLFFGSIEDLKMIDEKLAAKLDIYGISHLAIISLHRNGIEWGYLGVTYEKGDNRPTQERVGSELTILSQEVGTALNGAEKYQITNK